MIEAHTLQYNFEEQAHYAPPNFEITSVFWFDFKETNFGSGDCGRYYSIAITPATEEFLYFTVYPGKFCEDPEKTASFSLIFRDFLLENLQVNEVCADVVQ